MVLALLVIALDPDFTKSATASQEAPINPVDLLVRCEFFESVDIMGHALEFLQCNS